MKAAVMVDIGKIEIQDINAPEIGENEALIKVHYCGICGSDLSSFKHGNPYAPFPAVFGHEAAGEIAALGSPTDVLQIGDRVVYEISIGCGHCPPCRKGEYNCCSNIKIIGGHLPGAFAEYVKVPYQLIYKIPVDMPCELAAVCEPYSVSSQGCSRADIRAGDTVMIMGAGTIAKCFVDIAKSRGARVFMVARTDERLESARIFGADELINSSKENVRQRIMELTDNEGCDVVAEATGAAEVIEDLENYVACCGKLLIMSQQPRRISFSGQNFVTKQLTILGTRNSRGQYPAIIEGVYTKKLHAKELITDIYPCDKAQEAFQYAVKNNGKCGKVLLNFCD